MSSSNDNGAPKDGRFRKGQSGNPKGRPRRSTSAKTSIIDELMRAMAKDKITVRDRDGTHEVTHTEAVLKARLKSAVGGSPFAQRDYLKDMQRIEAEDRQRIEEEVEFWTDVRSQRREIFARAEREGVPAPAIYPHPEDIVIDRERGVRIVGPLNAEDQEKLEDTVGFRDLLLVQDVYDRRVWTDWDPDDPDTGPGSAMVFAFVFNDAVPKRYRLTIPQILEKRRRFELMTLRELRKFLFQSRRAQGRPVPRGTTWPPLSVGRLFVNAIAAGLDDVSDRPT